MSIYRLPHIWPLRLCYYVAALAILLVIFGYLISSRTAAESEFRLGNSLMNIGFPLLVISFILSVIIKTSRAYYEGKHNYKIIKPKVLAKSSEISLHSTQKHNGAMGEGDITRLKSIAELRDSGVLTEDEFQEQKSRILAESTGAASNQTHFTGEGKPLMKGNGNSIGTGGAVLIIVGVLFACVIIGSLFSGGSDTAEVLYSGCWSGAFTDGDSIISIDGCGNASFDCGEGYCGINAQKQEDNSLELCVKIGSDQACTTVGYGIASV